MNNRREFLKKSLLISGAAGLSTVLPTSIQKALAINPEPGSTYLDAEHVVILMQENRSFDHCFGTLQGVRGFNDPRAISLPNSNPVWLQSNAKGETYAPFRLNIKDTKATWMGSVPHSRSSQVDAFNHGKFDQWLEAKRTTNKKDAEKPLTLGYYTREDLPFNYALADAFTICDQNFCSAMTSTWPNRLFFWTGTIRKDQNPQSTAVIRNTLKPEEATWGTFPEKLEENGISWNVYQNDLTSGGGYVGEERSWLANYSCNPLEFFKNFNVKFSSRYVRSMQKQVNELPGLIADLDHKLHATSPSHKNFKKLQIEIDTKRQVLTHARNELSRLTKENFDKLSDRDKNLFKRAFGKNDGDPDFNKLATLIYNDGHKEHQVTVPKGDVLHRFRKDADSGKLPVVSWIVGPQNFSDHPSAPWYGAWYVSEIMDILTKNPEIWKKTIFILTYDENDGYFDHVPPFTPPDLSKPDTGKVSPGILTGIEHTRREQELKEGVAANEAREGAIGLGFRVPMIIASPWSRGGQVCSQVFDHTSTLQFLETFINKKFGKSIREDNISQWRRTICGNLTSAFSTHKEKTPARLPFLQQDEFIEHIHHARHKKEPKGYKAFSGKEIEGIKKDRYSSPFMPEQEKGTRASCPLPYQLYADGQLSSDKKSFEINMKASTEAFGDRSQGAPFRIYAPGNYSATNNPELMERAKNWSYAVAAGDHLTDNWKIDSFENGNYLLRLYGPNGFFREFAGSAQDPALTITCEFERTPPDSSKLTGNLLLNISNSDKNQQYSIEIINHMQPGIAELKITGGKTTSTTVNLEKSTGWYDFSVRVTGFDHFGKRYAGRVETGKTGITDPVMGGIRDI